MSSDCSSIEYFNYARGKPTVCVSPACFLRGTGAGADVDGAKAPQKKLKARKMLLNRADSPASSARFVGQFLTLKETILKKNDMVVTFENLTILF
jgi:hypothetical protein